MKLSGKILILLCIIILFVPSFLSAEGDIFTAAGFQYRIDSDDYRSRSDFFQKINETVSAICEEQDVDLLIFPEYIGVFYQLIRYNNIISRHDSFQSALEEVLRANPRFSSMADVFLDGMDDIESYLSGWAEISKKYGVGIISGSCFVPDEEGSLKNRSIVFDRNGSQIYYQDKVFLTDFEDGIIGLAPGKIEDASFFRIEGKNIVMTICRDAYLRDWEQKNSGAFLWVDIKANGEVFDIAQRQSFFRALPSRLFFSDVNYGMTVCTVGSYLDLFWQGESSAIRKGSDGLYLVAAAESSDEEDIVVFNIPLQQ